MNAVIIEYTSESSNEWLDQGIKQGFIELWKDLRNEK
jgi:hypothetical protein